MNELKLSVVLNAVDRMTAPLRAAMGGNRDLAKAVRATTSTMKDLESQMKLVDRFRAVNRGIGIKSQELEAAQAQVMKIRQEMDSTPVASAKMQRAFAQATATAKALKAEVNQLGVDKQRLRDQMAATGIDTARLSSAQADLKSKMVATNRTLDEQRAKLDQANQRMGQYRAAVARAERLRTMQGKIAGVGVGMAAAGAVVTAASMAPVKAYAEAEDASTNLKVAMMQAGGQVASTFDQINSLANTLGNRLPGTTADYQNMMTMLVRQGMSAQAILGGLGEATAYLAVQMKMPTEAAAEFASKLQDATRTSEKDMMGLMDTIQRTFYLGVDSNNMLDAFAKLSPSLSIIKKTGLEAADALAPLIVMADQAGMKGEAAGNAYRKIFQYTMDAKKLGKANAALGGTGIRLDFSNGKGEFGGIDQLFANLQKLRGLNTMKRGSVIKELFGDDAETLQAVSLMIDKGAAGYAEVQAKMANQADIQRRVNEQLGTLKNLWDAATGTFTNALATFGASIAPELHATAKWLGDVAAGIQNWAQNNPALAGTLMTIAKYLGLFLTVGGGLALVIAGLLGPLALMTTAAGALGLSLGPILLVVGAIAALGVAAIALIKNWDGIKEYFSTLFTDVGSNIINGLWSGISNGWQWLKDKVYGIAGSIADTVKEALGIRSPSRVFAELGNYTMEGFGMGLTDGQRGTMATMNRIMAGITAAGAISLSPAAMAGTGALPIKAGGQGAAMYQGSTIQITINPSPGMDESMLADLVARKIEEIERRRGSAARSSLRDRD